MNIKLVGKIAVGLAVMGMATVKLVKEVWNTGKDAVEEYICNLDPDSREDYMLYRADKELLSVAQLRDDIIQCNSKMEPTAMAFLMEAVSAHENLVEHPESAEAFDKFETVIEECEDELKEKILATFE